MLGGHPAPKVRDPVPGRCGDGVGPFADHGDLRPCNGSPAIYVEDTSPLSQASHYWDDGGDLSAKIPYGPNAIHRGVRAGSDRRLWHTGVAGIPARAPG